MARRASRFTQPVFANKDACTVCGVGFSVLANRRTHCRRCGESFCKKHCSRSRALPKYGITAPTRVCDACFSHVEIEAQLDGWVRSTGGGALARQDSAKGISYAALHSGQGLPQGFDLRERVVAELQAELSAFKPPELFSHPQLARLSSLALVRMDQVVRVLSATARRSPKVEWRALLQLACLLLAYEDEEPAFWMLQAVADVLRPRFYSCEKRLPQAWQVDAVVCADLVARFVPDLLASYEMEVIAEALGSVSELLFRGVGLDLLPLAAQVGVWGLLFDASTTETTPMALALGLLEIFQAQVVDRPLPTSPEGRRPSLAQRLRNGTPSSSSTPSRVSEASEPPSTPRKGSPAGGDEGGEDRDVVEPFLGTPQSVTTHSSPVSSAAAASPFVPPPANNPRSLRDALTSFASTVDPALLRARMQHLTLQLRELPAGGLEALRDEAHHRLCRDAPPAERLRGAGVACTLAQAQALVQHLVDSRSADHGMTLDEWVRVAAEGSVTGNDAAEAVWECAVPDADSVEDREEAVADWRDLIVTLACGLRGGFLDRLQLVFDAYDPEEAGALSPEVAVEALQAILRAGKRSTAEDISAQSSLGHSKVAFVEFYNSLRSEPGVAGSFGVPAARADSMAQRPRPQQGGGASEGSPLLGEGHGQASMCPCCVVS